MNRNIELSVVESKYFNNGKIILEYIEELKSDIEIALGTQIRVKEANRKRKGFKYTGVDAASLNKEIRNTFKNITGLQLETMVKDGIFCQKGKEGFDFASYDKDYNFAEFWNKFYGENVLKNAKEQGMQFSKYMGYSKLDWLSYLKANQHNVGENILVDKSSLTIVGEIQFGNWGLLYKDMFRLLSADVYPGVDLYIYITATGKLFNDLSDQIVNFKAAKKIISENARLIRTPIWLIGIDYVEFDFVEV